MNLQDITNLFTVAGAVALIVSAWLLFHELRTNNRLVRAANTQSLVALSSPFHLCLIQDRKLAEMQVHGAAQYEAMDEIDRYRYQGLLIWWLVYHENVYYQWRQGLLDDASYAPWAVELELFIEQHRLGDRWDTMRRQFQTEFAEHVSRLIASDQGHRTRPTGEIIQPAAHV